MPDHQINSDALEAAAKELFLEEENTAYVAYPEWDSPENIGKESYIEIARAAVSAYLAAALPEVTNVDYHATPEGHYDAWVDTGDGYTQRKGWTLTCIWCRAEFTGATKREALQGYRGHEESILQKLRETDAERAKNRPEVKP